MCQTYFASIIHVHVDTLHRFQKVGLVQNYFSESLDEHRNKKKEVKSIDSSFLCRLIVESFFLEGGGGASSCLILRITSLLLSLVPISFHITTLSEEINSLRKIIVL